MPRQCSEWGNIKECNKYPLVILNIRERGGHCRFGKSTHISMISNSVTHLRSYTNSAIADIAINSAPISPVTPRDCRRLRIEQRRLRIQRLYRRIEWPPRDRRRRCPKRRRLHMTTSSADVSASSANIVASNDGCFMMFHNVLSVSWCFISGSRCFTMFHNV